RGSSRASRPPAERAGPSTAALFRPGLMRRYPSANDNSPAPGTVLRRALRAGVVAAALASLLWLVS
ncbi:MAG TPA: hypothetical protein VJN41_08710, partial [Alphaproteobacteria bacterium]|nr:hypothetical protein [Alphaproteobacteria bacterium]